MKIKFFAGISVLWLGVLACRPVLAIGWGEFLFLIFVIAILIGPPLYSLIRKIENSNEEKGK